MFLIRNTQFLSFLPNKVLLCIESLIKQQFDFGPRYFVLVPTNYK